MQYIYVSSKSGSIILDTSTPPTTEQIQNLVGRPGLIGQIETLHRQFTHTSLVILKEQNGELKSLPVVARTHRGENIFGDFLVLRNVPYSEGYRLGGLTHSQILIAQDELQLAKQPQPSQTTKARTHP
jgi:hypothetical protein